MMVRLISEEDLIHLHIMLLSQTSRLRHTPTRSLLLCQLYSVLLWTPRALWTTFQKCLPVDFWHHFCPVIQFAAVFTTFPCSFLLSFILVAESPQGFSFLSPALCLIYFLLVRFCRVESMCDWSKFQIAEMEVGSRREVGGANDRMWARCRQNSWRCWVMSVTVKINTNMRGERVRAGGGAPPVCLLHSWRNSGRNVRWLKFDFLVCNQGVPLCFWRKCWNIYPS